MEIIEEISVTLSGCQITITEFDPELHNLVQLTSLLHRSYKRLADMGLNFWASSQPMEKALQRIESGRCLIAMYQNVLIGTICYYPAIKDQDQVWFKKESNWYKRADVGRFGQFAVDPKYQRIGLGKMLLKVVERLAVANGKQYLALDTADEATHLLRYYESLGFRHIEYIQWDNVTYKSTVMSKQLNEVKKNYLRKAVKTDCSRLLELINELAVYEKSPEKVIVSLAEFEDAGFGNKPIWDAFVVEYSGLIIGFALYYTRYSTWTGCRLYLEDFYVSAGHRGTGVGKLLFERVIRASIEGGFNGMSWQVLDWNKLGIDFYMRYGADLDQHWLNASLSKDQLGKICVQRLISTV